MFGRNCVCLLVFIYSLRLGALVYAQAKTVALPAIIKGRLDAGYPGWKLAEVSRDAYEVYARNRFPFQPNFLWGDFDGDGGRDYAVEITHPDPSGEQYVVIAFLRRGNGFQEYVLEVGLASPNAYLWPQKQGEKGFDFERNRYFWYRHDAVGVLYGEVAGVSYVFENGSFRKIVSSD